MEKQARHQRFSIYYTKYYKTVREVVRTLLYDKSAVDDIVHDVFTHYLHEQMSGLSENYVRNWLIVVARFKAIDHNRKYNSFNNAVSELINKAKNNTQDDYLNNKERLLVEIMTSLWEKDHYWYCVMYLRAMEDNTYKKIADIKNITVSEVRGILYYTRKWLSKTELYVDYKHITN